MPKKKKLLDRLDSNLLCSLFFFIFFFQNLFIYLFMGCQLSHLYFLLSAAKQTLKLTEYI